MIAEYFYEDRAGITGGFITAAHAEQLLERFDGKGNLEAGFEYCTLGAGGLRLVPVRVTPVDAQELTPDVLEQIAQIADELPQEAL